MRYLVFLLFSLLTWTLHAGVETIHLGHQKVNILFWKGSRPGVLVHLHENERTAYQAARTLQKEQNISMISLRHGGQRNIHFYLNHRRYEFDPNRMFSDRGIKKSLDRYSQYSPKAHQEIKKLANAVLKHLSTGAVIAVHNNRYYSMRDYLPGRGLSSEALKLVHHRGSSWRNFLLLTQSRHFQKMKSTDFNLVLQSSRVNDDGSLSVRLKGQSYANVEAAYHENKTQRKMILAAIRVLR